MIGANEVRAGKILIVDDQESDVRLLERALGDAGYTEVTSTVEPREVYDLYRANRYDLILLDLVMPGMDGFQVLESLKELEVDGYLPVLVVTAEPAHKLRALRAGARDFVSKPLDLAEVVARVHNLLEVRLLHAETRCLYDQVRAEQAQQQALERALLESRTAAERAELEHQRALARAALKADEPRGLVARSPAMRQVIELARRVARVDSTVLITGESGSGKERIARLIHEESTRSAGPFIAVNCGSVAETLLESELFGHVRGAFTGATQDRPGLFEAADGGTLLLDEVGEVSPAMQVKLLRALQEREVRRVGENRTRRVDVRILAATNRDLASGVAGGTVRQDLYYRLKVVELRVPALRERREDLLPLARILLSDAAQRMKRPVPSLSREAAERLAHFAWPGNVRELENAMERSVALARGARVELEDLPEEIRQAPSSAAFASGSVRSLEAVEKEYILSALALNDGNQTLTAEQLEIGSATLYRRLKSYGLIGARRANQRNESA
ncbi:MAG: sigma-54-dependent Fis family transcriptional regulator [Deltaproteobacteria bacterium]|nr:sigma-54-dependent Fis family transcriptional regulator [Deltaproteobacteria bacterium]